jgi:DNA-binding Xre family transcriptional regulator
MTGDFDATSAVLYPNGLNDCMARARINSPQLAAAAGTTRQQLHKLRHGRQKLTVQWAKRLAPHLNSTWQELVEGLSGDRAHLWPEEVSPERELLEAFWFTDRQGRELMLRLARSLRSVATDQREAAE